MLPPSSHTQHVRCCGMRRAATARRRRRGRGRRLTAVGCWLGGDGWLKHVRGQEVDRFIPIAYEMCGTWGTAARSFFKFVVKCAGSEGTRAAELYHWSAMTFGGHWRRRVAVEIGRGRVNCLGRSADPGYKGNSRSLAETAPDALT